MYPRRPQAAGQPWAPKTDAAASFDLEDAVTQEEDAAANSTFYPKILSVLASGRAHRRLPSARASAATSVACAISACAIPACASSACASPTFGQPWRRGQRSVRCCGEVAR